MRLTYGQLETVLANHLRIHPDKLATLRSRIKQLQRLQFPPGVNVGRGARMEYSGEHLFMLVTAFELIGAGHPAQTACNLVSKHWNDFAAGYALATLRLRTYRVETALTEADWIIAVIAVQSLHEIQFSDFGSPEFSKISITDEGRAASMFRTHEVLPHYTRLVISIEEILMRILEIAPARAGVKTHMNDDEFHDWLPKGETENINFSFPYPDRSNIEQRRRLQQYHGNDPDSFTPDGVAEAQEFIANNFGPADPF